jgi:hypothetical protein
VRHREIRFETTERRDRDGRFDVKLYVGDRQAMDTTLHAQVFETLCHSPRQIANVAAGWLSHAQWEGWL